jgi:hypothetical protein
MMADIALTITLPDIEAQAFAIIIASLGEEQCEHAYQCWLDHWKAHEAYSPQIESNMVELMREAIERVYAALGEGRHRRARPPAYRCWAMRYRLGEGRHRRARPPWTPVTLGRSAFTSNNNRTYAGLRVPIAVKIAAGLVVEAVDHDLTLFPRCRGHRSRAAAGACLRPGAAGISARQCAPRHRFLAPPVRRRTS